MTQIELGSLIIRKRRLQYMQASFLFGTPYQVQCIKSEDKYKELRVVRRIMSDEQLVVKKLKSVN